MFFGDSLKLQIMQQMQGRREKESPSSYHWCSWEKNPVPFLVLKAAGTVRNPQFLICMGTDWDYDCSMKRAELSSEFNFTMDINVYSSIQLNTAAIFFRNLVSLNQILCKGDNLLINCLNHETTSGHRL